MTEDEREAARLLEPLRHYRAPSPSRVDVKRAVRTGRRTILVRQVAGTTACLLAVLGIAFTLTFPAARPPAEAAGDFDVTVQQFQIGSAAGFTPLTYETGRDRQRAVLTAPGLDATGAVVTMFAKDQLPQVNGDPWKPDGEAAPGIGGRDAHWLPEPVVEPGGDIELAWQWASGAWGFVSLSGPDANRDRAVKVARSVEFDPGSRVTPAATLPEGTVDGAELTGVTFSIGDAGRAELVNEARYLVDGDPDAWIAVGARKPEDEATLDHTTEIGSRTAAIGEHEVAFRDGTGLYLQVSEELRLDDPLLELAEAVVLDPDFDWSSTPPLSSPTASPSSSTDEHTDSSSSPEGTSSSSSEETSDAAPTS